MQMLAPGPATMDPMQGQSLQEPAQPAKEQPNTGTTTASTPEIPGRPVPDTQTIAFTKQWLDDINNLPDQLLLEDVCRRINQELMPAWSDPKDPFKGRKSRTAREGEDDRRVNTPLAYLNVQQIVATVVPENHKVRWKPDPLANPTHLGPDQTLVGYAKSIQSITDKHTREVQWQDRLEGWIQEACIYPIGILKVFYERDTINEPVKEGASEEVDGQDQKDRIKQILEDLAAGRITKQDPQVVELQDLLASQNDTAEIEVRSGLVAQLVPVTQFGLPRACKALEDVYAAPWMKQDVMMSRKKIRKHYPYKIVSEGVWTGVHPDDLNEAQPRYVGEKRRRPGQKQVDAPSRGTKDNTTGLHDKAREDEELMLHELWDRESGWVMVFLNGVSYPIAKWKPTNPPAQWFPYHLMVLERLPGQVAGVSKVELQMDEQARINRKRSDEEIARYHSQPKGVCDSSFWDQDKQNQSVNLKPYKLKGLPLGGMDIEKAIRWFATPMVPAAYETIQDRQDLNRAANISAQALGVTGEADFAAEVDVAAQGTAISAQAIKNRVRRALERLYDAVAQILQQEVSAEEALELDPTVHWPKIYGDAEADQLYAQIRKEVRAGLLPEILAPYAAVPDPMGGTSQPAMPMPPAPEIERMLYEQAEPLVQKRCLETFGAPKPLSRETLYRRLRVHVTVVMDSQIDRNKRMGALLKLFQGTAEIITAAAAAGIQMDPTPLLKHLAPMMEADEDLVDEMFSPNPDKMAALLLQGLQEGGAIDPAIAAPLVQTIVASLKQAAAGAPPGNAPSAAAPPTGSQPPAPANPAPLIPSPPPLGQTPVNAPA